MEAFLAQAAEGGESGDWFIVKMVIVGILAILISFVFAWPAYQKWASLDLLGTPERPEDKEELR